MPPGCGKYFSYPVGARCVRPGGIGVGLLFFACWNGLLMNVWPLGFAVRICPRLGDSLRDEPGRAVHGWRRPFHWGLPGWVSTCYGPRWLVLFTFTRVCRFPDPFVFLSDIGCGFGVGSRLIIDIWPVFGTCSAWHIVGLGQGRMPRLQFCLRAPRFPRTVQVSLLFWSRPVAALYPGLATGLAAEVKVVSKSTWGGPAILFFLLSFCRAR